MSTGADHDLYDLGDEPSSEAVHQPARPSTSAGDMSPRGGGTSSPVASGGEGRPSRDVSRHRPGAPSTGGTVVEGRAVVGFEDEEVKLTDGGSSTTLKVHRHSASMSVDRIDARPTSGAQLQPTTPWAKGPIDGGGGGKTEEMSAQFNLEIALGTINELQAQLVHCNRTIEQLAAENVALNLDVKKAKKTAGRLEAKMIKQKQTSSEMTTGARLILQSTMEENTKLLAEFLEQVNKSGGLMERLQSSSSPLFGRVTTPPPPPEAAAPPRDPASECVCKHEEMKAVNERLAEMKKMCERVVEDKRALTECKACYDAKLKEAQSEIAAKDSQIASFRTRLAEVEGDLQRSKRTVKALQKQQEQQQQEQQQSNNRDNSPEQPHLKLRSSGSHDRMGNLRADYAALQKHALLMAIQNEQLQEQMRRLRNRQDRLQVTLSHTRQMYHRRGNTAGPSVDYATLAEVVKENDELRESVKEKERLLRTQMQIKSAITAELSCKRREAHELRMILEEERRRTPRRRSCSVGASRGGQAADVAYERSASAQTGDRSVQRLFGEASGVADVRGVSIEGCKDEHVIESRIVPVGS